MYATIRVSDEPKQVETTKTQGQGLCVRAAVELIHGKDEVPGSNPGRGSSTIKVITPCFAGGFLICNGVIYQQVDSSVDILNDYGLPV